MARPDIEKYSEQPKFKPVQFEYEDLLAKLEADKLDLGQDATNPITSSESIVDLTQQGLVSPDNFLLAYNEDKKFESSNLNLPSPSDSVAFDPGIQIGQSIDPTSPKEPVEEVASVASVPGLRETRDIGFATGKAITPDDSGAIIHDPANQLDKQMGKLLKPDFQSTIETNRISPSDPFDPLNTPQSTLPIISYDMPEVPAAGEDNLLNAINGTGRFAPGQEKPESAEDALGLINNLLDPNQTTREYDVRDTPAVRAITDVISGLGRGAFGKAILNDPVQFSKNFGIGLAQSLTPSGDLPNPFTVTRTLESYKNNWERMGFINQAAAIAYVGKLAAGVGGVLKEGISTKNFGDKIGNYLGAVGQNINLLGEGFGELAYNPENVAKSVSNVLSHGFVKGTTTDIDLLHGRISHSFDKKGNATTPGWIKGIMSFTPLSTGISLARGAVGNLLGGDDAHSQEAWSQVNAAIVGGVGVDISSGGENETDTKVYANGNTAYTNLNTRVPGDTSYKLLANTTRLPEGAIIGNLTTSQIDLMFPGTSPFTGAENAKYRTEDINRQLLATYKGLGGKSKNPTKEEYDTLVHGKINPQIRGFNSAINKAAGRDIVKNMDISDSRYIEFAQNEFKANELEAQTRGQKAPEIVEHSKQLGTLDDKPAPAPVTSGATGPPGRNYSTDAVDPGPAADTGTFGEGAFGGADTEDWGYGWARGGLVR